ncbi:MAG: sensor histidine kinase [Oceanicaulis sp.]
MNKARPLATVRLSDMRDTARVRHVAQTAAGALGFESWSRTRFVTAALELARNAVEHGGGGKLSIELLGAGTERSLVLKATDQGPGIPREVVRAALADALPASVRPTGGGFGLRGVVRLADRVDIESDSGGTRVSVGFDFTADEDAAALAQKVCDKLLSADETDRTAALAEQNKELLQALADRDLMLREFHHRTQNNLALITSMVRLRANASQSDEVRTALGDIASRITAIRDVYSQLQGSADIERLALKPFVKSLLDKLAGAVSAGRPIGIDVSGDDVQVGAVQAIDVSLLINELVTNACKHAFADHPDPRLGVDIADEGDFICLVVADNGGGLEDGQEPAGSSSLGWKVIRSVVAKFDGRLTVENDAGLKVTVRLSKAVPDLED